MYSRERDMKKEVAFMKVIQISDFHLREQKMGQTSLTAVYSARRGA